MDASGRWRQVSMRALLVLVAGAAGICLLARYFWELDPIHRGGRQLSDSRPAERIRGLLAIAEAPGVNDDPAQASAALPLVLQALHDEDATVRSEAIRCTATLVGSIMTHRAGSVGANSQTIVTSGVSALADALRDDDPVVRSEAATALGMLDPASAPIAPELLGSLLDPSPAVRRSVVIALSRMRSLAGDSDPFQFVENHEDPDPTVRVAILEALPSVYQARQEWRIYQERLGSRTPSIQAPGRSLVPPSRLLAGLNDPDRRVRAKCVTMLRPLALLRGLDQPVPGELARLIQPQKHEALRAFREALSDDSKDVRLAAAECAFATVHYGEDDAVPWLASSLAREKDPSVSLAIARVLARIGGDRAIAALGDALDEPRNRAIVPMVLAQAPFGHSESQAVIQRLTPLLNDESPAVRIETLRAIAAFHWRAADVLPQIVRMINSDDDAKVRQAANEARSAIGRPFNLFGRGQ